MTKDQVTGLILAGGLARRMDGREKGLLPLRGRPLVAHVLERLAPQVGRIVINANRHREDYVAFGPPVIADITDDFAGPLAGLQAGLRCCETPFIVTVPCDAPLLPNDLVARLAQALKSGKTAAAAFAANRLQPTFLLCRREVLADLERYIAAGGRKIHGWLADSDAVEVPFDDANAFANINTPDELALVESGATPNTSCD